MQQQHESNKDRRDLSSDLFPVLCGSLQTVQYATVCCLSNAFFDGVRVCLAGWRWRVCLSVCPVSCVMAVMAVPVMLELRTQNNHKKAIIYFLWLFVVHWMCLYLAVGRCDNLVGHFQIIQKWMDVSFVSILPFLPLYYKYFPPPGSIDHACLFFNTYMMYQPTK